MGEACRLALHELSAYHAACTSLREQLADALEETVPGLRRNSPEGGNCLPNTLHVSVEDIRGESVVAALDLEGIAVSAGSACAAGGGEPSHVLLALGHSDDQARNGVRFSFGRDSSLDEADAIAQITAQVVQRMRTAARLRGNDASA